MCLMSSSNDWKDEIRDKILKLFSGAPEDFARVLFYLDNEDKEFNGIDHHQPPAWKILKSTLYSDKSFKVHAKILSEDTKKAGKDEKFRMLMQIMHTSFQEANDKDGNAGQVFGIVPSSAVSISIFPAMAKMWNKISKEDQKNLLPLIKGLCEKIGQKQLIVVAHDIIKLVNKHGGDVVMPYLSVVYLSSETLKNIRRWWNGEISGFRCVKNIVDSSAAVGGGIGGGLAGASVGSIFGPGGTVLGGIFGSITGGYFGERLSDRLTRWIFGIPREEALENAFNYLNLKSFASNDEINKAYRHKLIRVHPDKGGNSDDFLELQYHMAVIKASKYQI